METALCFYRATSSCSMLEFGSYRNSFYAFTVQLPHDRCWSLDRIETALCFYRATSSWPMLEFGSYGNSFMLLPCNFLLTDDGVWIVWKQLSAFTVQLPHDRCWSLDRMETALCFYRATSSWPMLEFGSYWNSFLLLPCNFLMTDVGVWIVLNHLYVWSSDLEDK